MFRSQRSLVTERNRSSHQRVSNSFEHIGSKRILTILLVVLLFVPKMHWRLIGSQSRPTCVQHEGTLLSFGHSLLESPCWSLPRMPDLLWNALCYLVAASPFLGSRGSQYFPPWNTDGDPSPQARVLGIPWGVVACPGVLHAVRWWLDTPRRYHRSLQVHIQFP